MDESEKLAKLILEQLGNALHERKEGFIVPSTFTFNSSEFKLIAEVIKDHLEHK